VNTPLEEWQLEMRRALWFCMRGSCWASTARSVGADIPERHGTKEHAQALESIGAPFNSPVVHVSPRMLAQHDVQLDDTPLLQGSFPHMRVHSDSFARYANAHTDKQGLVPPHLDLFAPRCPALWHTVLCRNVRLRCPDLWFTVLQMHIMNNC
jgi:hypothetical protein